jgi:hypothetical protein
MGMTDRFALPVTTASREAVVDYVAAVELLLSANVGFLGVGSDFLIRILTVRLWHLSSYTA